MFDAIEILAPIVKGIWGCVCYEKGSAMLGLAGSRILEMALRAPIRHVTVAAISVRGMSCPSSHSSRTC